MSTLLLPLSGLFYLLSKVRAARLLKNQILLPVPVIVVGNISVGGSGKSPVVIALAKALAEQGLKPGVISRAYGIDASSPKIVTPDSKACESGDEPLMIAREARCPVAVCVDRVAAAQCLLANHDCDVVISDDGLQHYRLGRTVELCVVSQTSLGNRRCLPAGPLREPISRLQQVDFCLSTESDEFCSIVYSLEATQWRQVSGSKTASLGDRPWPNGSVHVVTSIAHSQRFFDAIAALGIDAKYHAFADHHPFSSEDFAEFGDEPVIMTMKDAVKCTSFAREHWWALDVSAKLPESLIQNIVKVIKSND